MISVILPTYNREKLIVDSIKSVLNQTYKDIELIVVDDGSIDNTVYEISKIKDRRIKLYSLPNNMGANYARNYGISKAVGEYIAFQDSDDTWFEDKLEKQMIMLKKINADIVCCALYSFPYGSKNSEKKKYPFRNESSFLSLKDITNINVNISTQTLLLKKECFEFAMFDVEMPRYQDWDLLLRLAKHCSIYYMDDILVNRYESSDSISLQPEKALKALNLIFEKNKGNIEKYPKEYGLFLYVLGTHEAKSGVSHKKTFFKSLQQNFTIKGLVKYIASVINIY